MSPGSPHNITAARHHAQSALYKAASDGMSTLVDKGYQGAGIGIKTPIKGHKLTPNDATFNLIHGTLRVPVERANALFKGFRALRRITLDPATNTKITATALIILHLNNTPRWQRRASPRKDCDASHGKCPRNQPAWPLRGRKLGHREQLLMQAGAEDHP